MRATWRWPTRTRPSQFRGARPAARVRRAPWPPSSRASGGHRRGARLQPGLPRQRCLLLPRCEAEQAVAVCPCQVHGLGAGRPPRGRERSASGPKCSCALLFRLWRCSTLQNLLFYNNHLSGESPAQRAATSCANTQPFSCPCRRGSAPALRQTGCCAAAAAYTPTAPPCRHFAHGVGRRRRQRLSQPADSVSAPRLGPLRAVAAAGRPPPVLSPPSSPPLARPCHRLQGPQLQPADRWAGLCCQRQRAGTHQPANCTPGAPSSPAALARPPS